MVKRVNPRNIKTHQAYEIDQAACSVGVSIPTIRGWIKKGLPVMRAQKPFLIIGADLREYIENARKRAKAPLQANQLYCLRCREARTPMGDMVDYLPISPTRGRLVGLCSECEGTLNRFCSRSALPGLANIFDIDCKGQGEA